MAKVFVSYSRKDIVFAKLLTAELQKCEMDFWIDWEGIPPTVDWWREIEKGIEEADIFLFLISPDSAKSKVCGQEIETAARNGKRIIPIVVRHVAWEDTPKSLTHLNYIFFREEDDFDAAVNKLITAIQTDYEWAATHRRLQVKALEWEREKKETSYLLRGVDLLDAEQDLATNSSKEPHPTDLQREYVFESRKATDRQRRTVTSASIAGVIVLAALTVAAILMAAKANTQAKIALARQWAAEANAILANPNGNAETAALLSLQALQLQQHEYVQSADAALVASLNHLHTVKIFKNQGKAKVSAVTYSTNGHQILIGYTDGTAGLYDAIRGEELQSFTGIGNYWDPDDSPFMDGVHSVMFSNSGDYFLMAASDGYIQVWNRNLGRIKEIHTGSYLLWSAEFSPDEKHILIGNGWPFGGKGNLEIWGIDAREVVIPFPQIHNRFVSDAEFSKDGNFVLSTSYDGTAVLWKVDWETHDVKQVHVFEPGAPIRDGAISPDGNLILLGLETGIAKLYKTDGSLVKNFVGHTSTITSVSFSSGADFILTASLDNTARLWNIEGGNIVRSFADHTDDIWAATFSPDGRTILTGSFDKTARTWKADPTHDNRIIYGHEEGILRVGFVPDGSSIISSSSDDSIRLWNAETLDQIRFDLPDELLDPSFAFSAQGRWLVAAGGEWFSGGGRDAKLIVWEKEETEYKPIKIIPEDWFIQAFAFSREINGEESQFLYIGPDNEERLLLQAGGDWAANTRFTIYEWNLEVAMTVSRVDESQYAAIATAPTIYIYRTDDPAAAIARCETPDPSGINFSTYGSAVIAFSQDGEYLVSELGRDIAVWDWQSESGCRLIRRLQGHDAAILDLTFSPDGSKLLSTSRDGMGIMWDVKSWQRIRTLVGHNGEVKSGAFSPDGRSIVTGGADKTIRIWDTDLSNTIRLVCSLLLRDFTEEERSKYGIPDTDPTCRILPVEGASFIPP